MLSMNFRVEPIGSLVPTSDRLGIRFEIRITYESTDSRSPSTVGTFRTSDFEVACEAYDLTKIPVGGYVQMMGADASRPCLEWKELVRK